MSEMEILRAQLHDAQVALSNIREEKNTEMELFKKNTAFRESISINRRDELHRRLELADTLIDVQAKALKTYGNHPIIENMVTEFYKSSV